MFDQHFDVAYRLKTFSEKEGEIASMSVKECHCYSDTSDIHYIFTDLFERHKGENVSGLEVLRVVPLAATSVAP